jgi:hypothetical protein
MNAPFAVCLALQTGSIVKVLPNEPENPAPAGRLFVPVAPLFPYHAMR